MYKYRNKIHIETNTDALEFHKICSSINGNIIILDGEGSIINVKSLMGMLCLMTFNELWCESDIDIYNKIEKFVV